MKAGELVQADDAFSLAIETQKPPPHKRYEKCEPSFDSDRAKMMLIEYHRERGKARQMLRNFSGARRVKYNYM